MRSTEAQRLPYPGDGYGNTATLESMRAASSVYSPNYLGAGASLLSGLDIGRTVASIPDGAGLRSRGQCERLPRKWAAAADGPGVI